MTSHPKAVFFDLDETLIRNNKPIPELFSDVFDQFAPQLGSENKGVFFDELRRHAGAIWDSMFNTNTSPEQQLADCFSQSAHRLGNTNQSTSNELGVTMRDAFINASSANVEFHSDSIATLRWLRSNGFSVGLITNGIEQVQLGKIMRLSLNDEVDHITISAQARAHKPKPQVFELALSRAGVNANEAWHIGDHATNDVAGAIRYGMQGLFYNPKRLCPSATFAELEEKPSKTIESLSEVVSLLS